MADEDEEDLLKAIDKSALVLLKYVRGDSLDADKKDLFIEQVKGFEAVCKWAEARNRISPPDKPKPNSEFNDIRSDFHNSKTERRRRARPGETAEAGRANGRAAPDDTLASLLGDADEA